MKTILTLIFISIATIITAQSTKTMTDPIPGADVKVGCKPPSACDPRPHAISDATGSVEFKDLDPSVTYYFEYGIKENGIKSQVTTYKSKDIKIDTRAKDFQPTTIEEIQGAYKLIITISASPNKGNVNTSRSNIKVTILKSPSNLK